MSGRKDYIYEFGPFRLSSRERALWHGDAPVPLSPRAIDLLLCLLSNAGHIVEKNELMRAVWADAFVEEGNLGQQIFHLRRVLGQGGEETNYIETVPRRGYRFVAEVRAKGAEEARGSSPIDSIAILPFKPIGSAADETQQALGLALADALITRIAALRGIRVLSTSAVRRYCDPAVDPIGTARELGVAAVLDATFQQTAGRVRASAHLLRASDGTHIWAGRTEVEHSDPLAMQDAMAEELARAIRPQLAAVSVALTPRRLRCAGLDDATSEAYVRARFHLLRYSAPDIPKAIQLFQEVTAAAPSFAPAYVGLALAHLNAPVFRLSAHRAAWANADAAARKAIELAPNLAEAQAAVGAVQLYYGWDWQAAKVSLETAVAAEPADPEPFLLYGSFLDATGRSEDALAVKRIALQLDPVSSMGYLGLAYSSWCLRRWDEVIEWSRKALELNPENAYAQFRLAAGYWKAQRWDDWARLAIPLAPYMNYRPEEMEAIVQEFMRNGPGALIGALSPKPDERRGPFTMSAILCLESGRFGEALAYLELGYENRDRALAYLAVDPSWDPLRGNPAFEALLRRMNLVSTKASGSVIR